MQGRSVWTHCVCPCISTAGLMSLHHLAQLFRHLISGIELRASYSLASPQLLRHIFFITRYPDAKFSTNYLARGKCNHLLFIVDFYSQVFYYNHFH